MKNKLKNTALVIALATSLSNAASAQELLKYADGDVFVGFRRTGTADTLAVNLGSVKSFLSPTQGGTNSSSAPFKINFGLRPGTINAVTSLTTDLTAVFGSNWSNNPTDGSGLRWAVVGFSGNSSSALEGFGKRSIFVTAARRETDAEGFLQPVLIGTDRFDLGDYLEFSTTFNSFAQGVGGGSFKNQNSTTNSTVAYRGKAEDDNNWGSRIDGGAEGSFGLGALAQVEQTFGPKSGPTESVLDFWASPDPGSTAFSANTYLGSFTLNNAGELIYWPATSNAPAPVVDVTISPINGSVGTLFQYQISASNFPTAYGATNLPQGLTVNTSTGLISGTPTAPGTNNVVLSATNPFGSSSNNLTLIFALQAPAITSPATANGTIGTAFSYQITASGTPTSFGASNLPAGLTLNATNGRISGTPTAAGTSTVNISATNAAGTGSRQLTITVAKRTQTISFAQPKPQQFKKGATFRLSANATPSGLPVTFVSSRPNVVSVKGNVATIRAYGTAVIVARQSGNGIFAAAEEVKRTVTIRK